MATPDIAGQAPPSLWRDRAFALFWTARTISLIGTAITGVVLPILLFRLTGSALQTSLLATLTALPYLVFGLPARALADRVDRKRLMIDCDLLRAATLASIPLAEAVGLLSLPRVYSVALLAAVAFVWFDAANFGALPALVGRDRLIEANSILWSTGTIIGIAAPALGGVLATALGPAPAIALSTRAAERARAARAMVTAPAAIVLRAFAAIREGLGFLVRHRPVRALTLLGFGNGFTGGAVTGLLVAYGVRALGPRQDGPRLGTLFTAGALGALGASLALPRLTRRVAVGRIALISLCSNSLMLLGVALAPAFIVGLVLLLWDACYTLIIISGIALRQIVTPEPLQSRVNATARMIAWGGALAEVTTIRATYAIMALGVTLSGAIGWFSPLREPGAARSDPPAESPARAPETG
jgi:MFS family permease